jgi:cystathionine beta-lyase/cystathionine gamma-synthase
LRQITDGEMDGYTYHRDDNPTVCAVEKQVAKMEGAEDCIVCTTGMAACTLIYLTYLNAGDNVIIFHDVYGAHYKVSLILAAPVAETSVDRNNVSRTYGNTDV